MLHAIRLRPPVQRERERKASTLMEEESSPEEPSKPLNETLLDLQLESEERLNITDEGEQLVEILVSLFIYRAPSQNVLAPRRISLSTAGSATSCARASCV